MHTITSSIGAAALHSAHGAPRRAFMQTRTFVDMAVLKAIQKGVWHPALVSSYRIQKDGGTCVDNAEIMQRDALTALHRKGLVRVASQERPGSAFAWLRERLGAMPALQLATRENPSVEQIVDDCRRHGPAVLNLARLLPPSQGGDQYASHHAVLLVGTLPVAGRHWGVALDGNDLQNNGIMKRLQDYADRHLDGRCDLITEGHMAAIRQEMLQQGVEGDVTQLVYSLLDLDHEVSKATKEREAYDAELARHDGQTDMTPITQPNFIAYAANAQVAAEFLPEPVIQELTPLISQQGEGQTYLRLP